MIQSQWVSHKERVKTPHATHMTFGRLLSLMCVLVAQSSPTLCDPVDCSSPGFFVHGILQARIPKWIAMPFSRVSSQHRDWTRVSHMAGRFFTIWILSLAPPQFPYLKMVLYYLPHRPVRLKCCRLKCQHLSWLKQSASLASEKRPRFIPHLWALCMLNGFLESVAQAKLLAGATVWDGWIPV